MTRHENDDRARSELLATRLAPSLSANALGHLREARVVRVPGMTGPPEALRSLLLRRGFPAPDALIQLEERVGGAIFPRERVLGPFALLRAATWLRPQDLPRLEGRPVFPILGDPERLAEEWEELVFMMDETGTVSVFEAPATLAPAFGSLEQLIEVEALAPLSWDLHTLRVDALCGELVAGLVSAAPHPQASGVHVTCFVGADVWVKELRLALHGPESWSSFHGTFLLSERLEPLVDAMSLLVAEGFSLGHRGPTAEPAPDAPRVLTFVDAHPELGHRASVEVTVWGEPGAYVVTRREHPRR